jgi:hypothetical protein
VSLLPNRVPTTSLALKLKMNCKVAADEGEAMEEEIVGMVTTAGGGDVVKEVEVGVEVAQTLVIIQLKNGVS